MVESMIARKGLAPFKDQSRRAQKVDNPSAFSVKETIDMKKMIEEILE